MQKNEQTKKTKLGKESFKWQAETVKQETSTLNLNENIDKYPMLTGCLGADRPVIAQAEVKSDLGR